MRFSLRARTRVLFAVMTVLALSGCGLLADRTVQEKALTYSTGKEGCLNEMGSQAERYLSGEISENEWTGTWSCVLDNLAVFRKYIQGSDAEGFTVSDVHALVKKFMVTSKEVPEDLIAIHFELKEKILGGSSKVFTYREFDQFVDLLKKIGPLTVEMLPHLNNRAHHATSEKMAAFGKATENFVGEMLKLVDLETRPTIEWATLETFARGLASVYLIEVPADLFSEVRWAKDLVLPGNPAGISGPEVKELLRSAFTVAIPLIKLAFTPSSLLGDNLAKARTYLNLVREIRPEISKIIARQAGVIDWDVVFRVINRYSPNLLQGIRGAPLDQTIVRKALPTVTKKFLGATNETGIDEGLITEALSLVEKWITIEEQLDKVFRSLGVMNSSASSAWIATATDVWAMNEGGLKAEILRRISDITKHQEILFQGSDAELTFNPNNQVSRLALEKVLINQWIVEKLLSAYSSDKDKRWATQKDLETFFAELGPLIAEFQVIDPTVKDYGLRRYTEASLFMFSSNGDEYLDKTELTYYFGFLSSIFTLSRRINAVIGPLCSNQGVASGDDHFGWSWMDVTCFRREYFSRFEEFWDHSPQVVKFFADLAPDKRDEVQNAMERAGRFFGASDTEPVGTFDTEGYAGVIHYVEAIFHRFDSNYSQKLDLGELEEAFPVFKLELSTFGNIPISQESMLEAIFMFTVRYGAPPEKTAAGYANFLTFWAMKPVWQMSADRLALYKVLASLAAPPPGF